MAEEKLLNAAIPNLSVRENRIGIIHVNDTVMYDSPSIYAELMARLLVFKCEFVWRYKRFEIVAYSNHFDANDPACEAPKYCVKMKKVIDPNNGEESLYMDFKKEK